MSWLTSLTDMFGLDNSADGTAFDNLPNKAPPEVRRCKLKSS